MSAKFKLMKSFGRNLFLALAFLPFGLAADTYVLETGHLTKITNTHVFAGDLDYKLSPTVKVVLISGKSGSVRQLSKGDYISMKILTLDRKSYVDTIIQLPDQSEESSFGDIHDTRTKLRSSLKIENCDQC